MSNLAGEIEAGGGVDERERCGNCRFGKHFTPRRDELKHFGSDVMGCRLPRWEGYTLKSSLCIAYVRAVESEARDG